MSFRCDFCGKAQPPNVKPTKVKTKVRRESLEPVQTRDLAGMVTVSAGYREFTITEKAACPACAGVPRDPEVVWV